MKTRSNMPLFVVETDNVKALSNSQIDLLRCGDYLVKKDASGEHAYKVTFKSDTGMCITYMDAYCVETQSYDKVDGNWVYNSEDKSELPIYWHTINIQRYFTTPDIGSNQCNCYLIILNNNPNAMTKEEVMAVMKTQGFYAILHSGVVSDSNSNKFNQAISIAYLNVANHFVFKYYNDTLTQELTTVTYNFDTVDITDLGVNKIN